MPKTSIPRAILFGFCTATLLSQSAHAANIDNDVTFTGSILESCSVTILTSGLLGVSSGQDALSSEEVGGLAATATIVTNSSNSSIRMVNPLDFTSAPSGASTNVSFDTNYLLVGTTVGSQSDGETETTLNFGLTTMTMNASATKSSGTLPTGDYTLTPTLRCITI